MRESFIGSNSGLEINFKKTLPNEEQGILNDKTLKRISV